MSRSRRLWAILSVAGTLGACSGGAAIKPPARPSHQGEASYQALADEHMAHYQLALGSTSTGAEPIVHPAPSYPGVMLARCPAQVRLQVLLIVGSTGTVDEARFNDPVAVDSAFVDAVRAAVLGWRFEPLIISHWAADAHGATRPVDAQAKPFSLPYEFSFACHAGKAQVSGASTALP